MHKSVKLLLVMLFAFGGTAFLLRHRDADPFMWIAVLAMMLPIWAVYGFSSLTDFVEAHSRATFWCGVAIVALGLVALFGAIWLGVSANILPNSTGQQPGEVVVLCTMGFGVALAVIPRGIPALRRAQAAEAAKKASKLAGKQETSRVELFAPVRNGVMASIYVCRNIGLYATIFGPWLFLTCAVPIATMHFLAFRNHLTATLLTAPWGKLTPDIAVFGGLLPIMALVTFGVPTALVAWHRSVAGYPNKRWVMVPDGAMPRYLWRLYLAWIIVGVIGEVVATNSPDLARFIGVRDAASLSVITYLLALLAVAFLSAPSALVLPAIAVRRYDLRASDSIRMLANIRASFSLGFVLALLPFSAVCVFGIWEALRVPERWLAMSMVFGALVALSLALASVATYVTQAYVALTKAVSESVS